MIDQNVSSSQYWLTSFKIGFQCYYEHLLREAGGDRGAGHTLHKFQSAQGARPTGKFSRLQAQMLEIGHQQITERRSVILPESEMLAVTKMSPCRDNRQVGVVMTGSISQVRPP